MEKKELELALKTHGENIEQKQAELKKLFEEKQAATEKVAKDALEAKAKELQTVIEAAKAERKAAQDQLDALETKLAKMEKSGIGESKSVTLNEAVKSLIESEDFKAAKKDGFRTKSVFEIKADTSDITGTVNMTAQNYSIGFAPDRALAFYPMLNQGFIGQNRNRVLWVEGAYTSNVGYVGEGTGQGTADTGTAVEKSRAMAKISAKLPLTAELLEDADYIASAFRMKMQEKALLFADGEFYTGDGSDGVNPNHIYGIVGQSTAFNPTTAGVLAAIATPNIGDLIDSCILQAELSEQKGLDTLWINPSDFFKMRYTKDANGQYLFVKGINGNYTINSLNVVRSSKVTADTLTIADSNKPQAWWKRNPEIKFSQMNGTDFVDDAYTAVLFLRAQCIVEAQDQTAIIHVASIATSLNDITKVTA
ncbi:MAG: phage major capsid protein [Actinobacteria bacterium]|nr:phage major capsid protein [Actinomycetota bacterium]